MTTVTKKHAELARLSSSLDHLLRDQSIPSPRAGLIRRQIERAEKQLEAVKLELTALPLEEGEIIEIRSGEHRGKEFVIHALPSPDERKMVLLRHLHDDTPINVAEMELRQLGFSRKAKWSGKGRVPSINSEVYVVMNQLGPATVLAHQIIEGWLGLRVRFHNPPAWYVKQNKNRTEPGLVFGAEIRQ